MSGTQSSWRAPRLRMLANGSVIVGAKDVDITSNNHYAADIANGEVSLGADPAFGMAWWDQQSDITLDVQIALLDGGDSNPAWQSIIVATVDHLRFDLTTNCVRFDARDLTARFIETKTQATYANNTSSEIAQKLAAAHGMQASVQPTKTIVGQYYQLEHDRIALDNFSHQTTEWDLLTYLAQEEDFDVWVQGNTLYFQPPSANTKKPYQVIYRPGDSSAWSPTLNLQRLAMERSLTLAKDMQVTVKSTNLRSGQAFIRIVKAQGAKSPNQVKSATQNYVFTKPGLTPDQALKFGQQKLAELSRHERVISMEMPGELDLTPRDMIQLSGTNSGFDTVFFIDTINRRIDFEQGFCQNVRAKNTSPRTQTTVL